MLNIFLLLYDYLSNLLIVLCQSGDSFDLDSAADLDSTVDIGSWVYSTNCLPDWGVDLVSDVDLESRNR